MALSLQYWRVYVEGFSKLSRKSESMVEANRILKFSNDPELMVVSANVQASMRDRNYKIKVSLSVQFEIYADGTAVMFESGSICM